MLTVTDEAFEELGRRLRKRAAAAEAALRFHCVDGRWRLRVGRAEPEDATFAHRGRPVLLLDHSAAKALSDAMLLMRDTPKGPRLNLRHNSRGSAADNAAARSPAK